MTNIERGSHYEEPKSDSAFATRARSAVFALTAALSPACTNQTQAQTEAPEASDQVDCETKALYALVGLTPHLLQQLEEHDIRPEITDPHPGAPLVTLNTSSLYMAAVDPDGQVYSVLYPKIEVRHAHVTVTRETGKLVIIKVTDHHDGRQKNYYFSPNPWEREEGYRIERAKRILE